MSSPNPLEYDEEDDIFEESAQEPSDGIEPLNPAQPIIDPNSRLSKEDLAASYDARARAEELRVQKLPKPYTHSGNGPISLKMLCQWVAKRNARNIVHIGHLSYSDIGDVINELPMKQISLIEENSPHVKKSTDWLWESFLLQDYPLYHQQCWIRKGVRRDTGWRRMYQKAKEELEERKARVAKIASEGYKKVQEDRAAHRIATTTRSQPTKKMRTAPHKVQSHFGAGSRPISSAPAGSSAMSKAIAAARKDTQRARIAMTHASGQVLSVPSMARPREKVTEEHLFKVPTASPSSSTAPTPSSHALAPPRSNIVASASAKNLLGPGSSLRQLPKPPPMEIRKAEVPSFTVPVASNGKRSLMDAFGTGTTSIATNAPTAVLKKARPMEASAQLPSSSLPAAPKPPMAGASRPPPQHSTNGMFIPKKKPRIANRPTAAQS